MERWGDWRWRVRADFAFRKERTNQEIAQDESPIPVVKGTSQAATS
ncbi:MAG: hypothetical protein H8E35_03700 [Ardenticatenia bacterium]|nr:hypothetical protein [Ardenticatenia bacterium]